MTTMTRMEQRSKKAARTTMAQLTSVEIRALGAEAGVAGDAKLVATCDRALAGSQRARRQVLTALRAAKASR
jgi:hypothetical protein